MMQCRSALLHSINLPGLQQEPSLTALISPDASAKSGTFTPPGAGAALSCRISELVWMHSVFSQASDHATMDSMTDI